MSLRSENGIFLTSATPVLFYMLSELFDGDEVFDSVVRVVRQNVFVQQICLAVIVVPIPLDVIRGPAFPLPERIWNRRLKRQTHMGESQPRDLESGARRGCGALGAGAGKMVRRGDVIQQRLLGQSPWRTQLVGPMRFQIDLLEGT